MDEVGAYCVASAGGDEVLGGVVVGGCRPGAAFEELAEGGIEAACGGYCACGFEESGDFS